MSKTKTRIHRVPEDAQTRAVLAEAVRSEVSALGLQPPVVFAELKALAVRVVNSTGADPDYTEFAMVLAGNEIWRPMVAATPYHRRLLLLPQCLKNNHNCRGVFDELGLICNGCHSCSLDNIVTAAERLGYHSLIAEGTTVALGLVEEGSVDAVIGVSCMSTLERSFDTVKRSALPVVGIPLLCEGCSETTVDEGWLFRELYHHKPDPRLQPLSVSLLKNKVSGYFSEENLRRLLGNENDPTMEMALRSMLQGGQRIRPLLTTLAWSAYTDNEDEELPGMLAVIIECFHKASLIHDDIEDRDDFRYDQETLHKREGVPLAINAGDYLTGKGYELLGRLPVSCEKRAACLSLVASAHVTLTLGQGADLLAGRDRTLYSTAELLRIYAQKTGAAVEVALLLGAVAAGADEADLKVLKEFARQFGIAYQVRDDLEEFQRAGPSLQWFDYPFLLAFLKEHLNGHSPEVNLTERPFSDLKEIMDEAGIESKTASLVKAYVAQAYETLDRLSNLRLRLSLHGVLGKIFSAYES